MGNKWNPEKNDGKSRNKKKRTFLYILAAVTVIAMSGLAVYTVEAIRKIADLLELEPETIETEIKASKEDDSGTELGWFAVFTAEKTAEHPILLVSMTEDVKDRGGSDYVVEKDRMVLEKWFGGDE